MPTKTRRKTPRKPKKSFEDRLAEQVAKITQVMRELKDGKRDRKNWLKPFKGTGYLPMNGIYKKPYSGYNTFFCWLSGYSDHRWYTRNQMFTLNGYVWEDGKGKKRGRYVYKREGDEPSLFKGEKGDDIRKGTPIVAWVKRDKKEEDKDGNEVKRPYWFPVLHVVWNHEQVNWVEECEPQMPDQGYRGDANPEVTYTRAAEFFDALPVKLTHTGEGRACYSPTLDEVRMPFPKQFDSPEAYYATRAHETVHWTGHVSRLDRNQDGVRGSSSYAEEELVAEMGAAMLSAILGVSAELDENHIAYLDSWIEKLNDDPRFILTAGKAATSAVTFLTETAGIDLEAHAKEDEEIVPVLDAAA